MQIERIEVDAFFLKGVRQRLGPGSYIECGNCNALKIDSIALAKLLDQCETLFSADEDESDSASELLSSIIEGAPEIMEWEKWCEWEKANSDRHCAFLDPDNYGNDMYVKYGEVVLTTEKRCQCFL